MMLQLAGEPTPDITKLSNATLNTLSTSEQEEALSNYADKLLETIQTRCGDPTPERHVWHVDSPATMKQVALLLSLAYKNECYKPDPQLLANSNIDTTTPDTAARMITKVWECLTPADTALWADMMWSNEEAITLLATKYDVNATQLGYGETYDTDDTDTIRVPNREAASQLIDITLNGPDTGEITQRRELQDRKHQVGALPLHPKGLQLLIQTATKNGSTFSSQTGKSTVGEAAAEMTQMRGVGRRLDSGIDKRADKQAAQTVNNPTEGTMLRDHEIERDDSSSMVTHKKASSANTPTPERVRDAQLEHVKNPTHKQMLWLLKEASTLGFYTEDIDDTKIRAKFEDVDYEIGAAESEAIGRVAEHYKVTLEDAFSTRREAAMILDAVFDKGDAAEVAYPIPSDKQLRLLLSELTIHTDYEPKMIDQEGNTALLNRIEREAQKLDNLDAKSRAKSIVWMDEFAPSLHENEYTYIHQLAPRLNVKLDPTQTFGKRDCSQMISQCKEGNIHAVVVGGVEAASDETPDWVCGPQTIQTELDPTLDTDEPTI